MNARSVAALNYAQPLLARAYGLTMWTSQKATGSSWP